MPPTRIQPRQPAAPPEARVLDGRAIKIACSNCSLRELCMPVGLA